MLYKSFVAGKSSGFFKKRLRSEEVMLLRRGKYILSSCCAFLLCIIFLFQSERVLCADKNLIPDIRILIDSTESMQKSDPKNLRISGLRLLVKLLPNGAKAGVWLFSDTILTLIPHGIVDDAWRIEALQIVDKVDIENSGQRANIPEALTKALHDTSNLDSRYRVGVILLTDGGLDVSSSPIDNAVASTKLLNDIANNFPDNNVPIHTIGLKQAADKKLLGNLAEKTSGLFEQSDKPEELAKIYLNFLDILENRAFVTLNSNRFPIDETVREFTLVVFRFDEGSAIEIISPDGTSHSRDRVSKTSAWFENESYAIFTSSDPTVGYWSIKSDKFSKARITVVSDLQIETTGFPNSIPVGSENEFKAWISFKKKKITDLDFLSSLDLELTTNALRGGGSKTLDVQKMTPLESGEFRVLVPGFQKAGRYNLTLKLTGKKFNRVLPNYVDVFALTDSDIDTRPDLGTIPSFIFPSTIIILMIIALLISLAIILLILKRISAQEKERWKERLSSESRLN